MKPNDGAHESHSVQNGQGPKHRQHHHHNSGHSHAHASSAFWVVLFNWTRDRVCRLHNLCGVLRFFFLNFWICLFELLHKPTKHARFLTHAMSAKLGESCKKLDELVQLLVESEEEAVLARFHQEKAELKEIWRQKDTQSRELVQGVQTYFVLCLCCVGVWMSVRESMSVALLVVLFVCCLCCLCCLLFVCCLCCLFVVYCLLFVLFVLFVCVALCCVVLRCVALCCLYVVCVVCLCFLCVVCLFVCFVLFVCVLCLFVCFVCVVCLCIVLFCVLFCVLLSVLLLGFTCNIVCNIVGFYV